MSRSPWPALVQGSRSGLRSPVTNEYERMKARTGLDERLLMTARGLASCHDRTSVLITSMSMRQPARWPCPGQREQQIRAAPGQELSDTL